MCQFNNLEQNINILKTFLNELLFINNSGCLYEILKNIIFFQL